MKIEKDPGLEVFRSEDEKSYPKWQTNPSKPLDQTSSDGVTDKTITPESLYSYSLGIRDIQARSIHYGEKQAYVTKPLPVPGNVMEVQIESLEDHPLFDEVGGQASDRQTSIEYSISYKKKPGVNDWISLLPLDQKTVRAERLLPDVNGEAQLRFPSQMETIRCFANGMELAEGRFSILSEDRILLEPYNPGVIYTISYTPDSYRRDPWTFRLSEHKKDVVRKVETFPNGTSYNKTVTLEASPFLDLSRMREEESYNPNTSTYKPISVSLKNATIQGEGRTLLKEVQPFHPDMPEVAYTYNRTLYEDKSWSALKPYSLEEDTLYKGFDYYQWKNKVTFTEHFDVKQIAENLPYTHGNAEIEVSYDTLLTDFRLKIILRRNTGAEQTVTPEVIEYSLLFKTIE